MILHLVSPSLTHDEDEVIFKTCGLLVVLSSPPDTLPITLPGPHEMIKANSSILGAHTHVVYIVNSSGWVVMVT